MTSHMTSPGYSQSPVGAIDPASYNAGAQTSAWIKADKFHKYLATVQTGVLGASATLDVKFQQASAADGTGAKDITGKAAAQLVKASHDNKQITLALTPSELDYKNGFHWFRLSATVGTAASIFGAVIHGIDPKFGPASTQDAASVVEVVV